MKERKGNPLMICGLPQAMLDRVGIDADFLLIHPRSEGYFDNSYISPSQIGIPAVGATIDGREYVVFPFLEGLPVTYIPVPFQGTTALEVTPEGFGGFRTIPDVDVEAYAVSDVYDIEVTEDGKVHVEETKTLRDIAAYVGRQRFEDLDDEEREEEVRALLT